MRQRWYIRGLFATAVGMGVVAGLARAGSQTQVTPPTGPASAPVVQPGAPMPSGTAIPPAASAPVMQPIPAGPYGYPTGPNGYDGGYPGVSYDGYADGGAADGSCPTCGGHKWLGKHHLFGHFRGKLGEALECSCWAHHDCQGCGSLQSDLHFIFGSCRDYFSEPCLKGPLPPPMPGGYPQGSVDPNWRPITPYGQGYGAPPGTPGYAMPPGGYSSGTPVFDRNQLATRMPVGQETGKNISGPIVVAPSDNATSPTRIEATTVARPVGGYQFQQGGYR